MDLAARQYILVVRLDIEVAQLVAGLAGGHQEHLVADGALAAAGGGVDGLGGGGVRLGDGHGSGAAAVQAQRRHAAQLYEPLGHLGHGRTDGVAGLAAVNGVEHQRTVSLLAHGGAGVGTGGESGDHGAVFHQGVKGAQGVLHVIPLLAGGRGGEGDGGAHGDLAQGVHVIAVGLGIGREHHLVFPDGRGGGSLPHLVHRDHQGFVQSQRALLNGAQHVHAGLGGAGGMLGVEVIGIEVNAAGGHPGLVDAGQLAHHLGGVAGVVRHGVAQVGRDLDGGLAQHGGTVGAEADGVIAAVTAADLALGHHKADGQARAEVIEVAVHAGHHTVALALQGLGGGGDGIAGGEHAAVGHHGGDGLVGRVSNEVLRSQIGVAGAPEHVGGKLRLFIEQLVLKQQVLSQCLRRGGAHAQGAGQGRRKAQR